MEKKQLKTVKGYEMYEAISALQKSIRRGKEDDALYWGVELLNSGFGHVAWKRMLVMSTEDIGLANPVAPVAINAYKQRYDVFKDDDDRRRSQLPYLQAIVYLAQSRKSRHADWALNYWFDSHLGTAFDKPKPDAPVVQPTIKGYDRKYVIDAFRDAIVSSLEGDAMFWGVELIESGFVDDAWKVLTSLSTDSFRYGDPMAEDIIVALRQQYLDLTKHKDKKKQFRLPYTQAILYLVSVMRWSAHVNDAFDRWFVTKEGTYDLRSVPDYALDIHTWRGRAMGKTIDTFFTEGSIIENAVEIPNEYFYRDECRKRWNSKEWCAKADAEKARREQMAELAKKPKEPDLFG